MLGARTNRRQFLIGGAAASLSLIGWRGNVFSSEEGSGVDEYVLRVGYSERSLGSFHLRTRTYNSGIPGPLMVARPGRTLRVRLINHLPPDPPATAPPGIDALNNPHAFNIR